MKNPDDGYYYVVHPVAAGHITAPLIISCYPVTSKIPEGCKLSVEIIASAIQSEPYSTAETAWGLTIGEDGFLDIKGAEVTSDEI